MNLTARPFFRAVLEIADSAGLHRIGVVASGAAFYVLLALIPTSIVFALIAGQFLASEYVSEIAANVTDSLQAVATSGQGDDLWTQLENLAVSAPSIGLFTFSGAAAVLIALYSSSRAVVTVRQTFDSIFNTSYHRNGLILRAFSAVVSLIGVVVFALIAAAFVIAPRIVHDITGQEFQFGDTYANWLFGAAVVYMVVKLTYEYAPHRGLKGTIHRVPWTSIGLITGTVWIIAVSLFLGFFLSVFSGSSVLVFGAPIVLLLWLSTTIMGLFVGGEIVAWERQQTQLKQTRQQTGN